MEVELVERESRDHREPLGDVPVAGVTFVDPIADDPALERAADDVVDVDLAGEDVVDEQPEPVGSSDLAFAVSRGAS